MPVYDPAARDKFRTRYVPPQSAGVDADRRPRRYSVEPVAPPHRRHSRSVPPSLRRPSLGPAQWLNSLYRGLGATAAEEVTTRKPLLLAIDDGGGGGEGGRTGTSVLSIPEDAELATPEWDEENNGR